MLKLGPDIFDLLNAKQWVGNQQPVVYGKGGMSLLEVQLIEAKLGFRMPSDFAFLLQNIRDPGSVLFPWSTFKKHKYEDLIEWVRKGIERNVEGDSLWLSRWGERPEGMFEALQIVRADFETWPKLLPIYGHRFLAAEPLRSDNPVFSIMGTDIVYYGANLAYYLINEFIEAGPEKSALHLGDEHIRKIDVWSDFVDPSPGFYSDQQVYDALKAAETHAVVRRERALRMVIIELTDGDLALVEGEKLTCGPDLEAKLAEIANRDPPTDIRFNPDAITHRDFANRCKTILSALGYKGTSLLFRTAEGEQSIGPIWFKED